MATKKRTTYSLGLREVNTARARKAVRQYLDAFKSGDNAFEDIATATERLSWLGNEAIAALAEVMVEGNPDERVLTAWMLWFLGNDVSGSVSPKTFEECQSVLARALNGDGNQRLACVLLTTGSVPSGTIGPLCNLLHNDDPQLSVPAAASLIQLDLGEENDADTVLAIRSLGSALRGEDHFLAGIAGCSLIRFGVRDNEAAREITELLPNLSENTQYAMLQTISQLGPRAQLLSDVTASIVADTKKHAAVREAAAFALGCISAGSAKATPALMNALKSPHWQVVNGALRGLLASENLPIAAAENLVQLLGHEDENMRGTAANGLAMFKERAVVAVPTLVGRLKEESNSDVASILIKALSAIGEAAIPSLVDVIAEGDGPKCEYAMRALSGIGGDAARTLAELILETDNARIRNMLLGTLVMMGRRATPAIPVMAEILDETDDDELANCAALGLFFCGPSAVIAVNSLIRCVAIRGCDDPIGALAERALWSMKEAAIPRIEDAIKETSGTDRTNLKRALAGMDVSFGSDLGRLLHFNRDDLLALFVDVGTVLEEQGATSWRAMAEVLREKMSQGLLTPGYAGSGERFIGKSMKLLSKYIKGDLTTHGNNQKGGLTPEGRVLLKEAREYLRKKSLERERYAKKSR